MHQGIGSESADDAEVLAERLQSEVEDLLDAFRVRETLGRLGETHVVGSAVSRLMTHPEVDVVAHAGDGFGIGDALRVADELATRGRVVEVMATEERGPRFSGPPATSASISSSSSSTAGATGRWISPCSCTMRTRTSRGGTRSCACA